MLGDSITNAFPNVASQFKHVTCIKNKKNTRDLFAGYLNHGLESIKLLPKLHPNILKVEKLVNTPSHVT